MPKMRIKKEFFLIVVGIILVFVMGNVLTLEPEIQAELIQGQDCQIAHGEYYLLIEANYNPLPVNSPNGTFTVTFIPTSPELLFDVTVKLS
ncbi:MAG: hypothetical protein ACTSR2_04860, partial [Candidatus Hodarchaeales archaeon]